MHKIPTIFRRNPANKAELLDEPHGDCHWVFEGAGVPTRKFDGTCCLYDRDGWSKRRTVKHGDTPPADFMLAEADTATGNLYGWVRVTNEDIWHLEAIRNTADVRWGTYELCGPKVQGNPDGLSEHIMIRHDTADIIANCPSELTYDKLNAFLQHFPFEGIVWLHPDGRMAKIKRKDFGWT